MPDAPPSPRDFLGKFRPVLDPKHRITVPRGWRESNASERFYVMPSRDRSHLVAMPRPEFDKTYNDLLDDQTIPKAERRSFQRVFFSEVEPCETDGQGRMVISEEFCQVAGLQGELLLLGSYTYFEIWSPARWEAVHQREVDTANRVGASQGL